MKLSQRALVLFCILTAVGLAIGVVVERQAGSNLAQQNKLLRQQLSLGDALIAENRRLSNLVVEARGSSSTTARHSAAPIAADERMKELVRLRGEVEALRQQSQEVEDLRADTRQLRLVEPNAPREQSTGPAGKGGNGTLVNGSPFEILRAEYGTERTNLDVAVELGDRIRGDGLKAVVSNNLKGDPDFGQVKRLTVVYRFGGVTKTNEFREGDVIELPSE
jgi:hypothetical protein